MVVSPELADVLSTIIRRVRTDTGAVPVIPAYDRSECVWLASSPWLFQRRFGVENRRICEGALRNILNAALAHTGMVDPTTGHPLHYTPHDFRRIFITDAILSGLPPHGTVNLLELSGGTGMVGSGGSVCVAWIRPHFTTWGMAWDSFGR